MSAVKGALMYASCDQVALENLLPRIASSWANEHGCIWALVYTPSECVLTRVTNDGKLEPMPGTDGADDRAVTAAYEARVFSRQGEVRWQDAGGGVFRAVCIYDEGAPPDGFASPTAPVDVRAVSETRYLLLGEGLAMDSDHGWSLLGNARFGRWQVPVPDVAKGKRVALKTKEYIGLLPGPAGSEHGNCGVLDERLCGLFVEEGESR